MDAELTPRQSEVVALIRQHVNTAGFPPSTRELADALGVSSTAVEGHLSALQKKGVLRRSPGIARGIRILTPGVAR